MFVVNSRLTIPWEELRFSYARSSGPGGQNVNKVNSKVTLAWTPADSAVLPPEVRTRLVAQQKNRISKLGELLVTSERFRDRGRNVTDCLEKLRAMVQAAWNPPKKRRPTRPTRSSQERRLKDKRAQSQRKSLRKTAAE